MARITPHTMIQLTPAGNSRVETMRGSGPGQATLTQLYDSGGMTVSELMSITSTNSEKMAQILKVLKRHGLIRIGIGEGIAP